MSGSTERRGKTNAVESISSATLRDSDRPKHRLASTSLLQRLSCCASKNAVIVADSYAVRKDRAQREDATLGLERLQISRNAHDAAAVQPRPAAGSAADCASAVDMSPSGVDGEVSPEVAADPTNPQPPAEGVQPISARRKKRRNTILPFTDEKAADVPIVVGGSMIMTDGSWRSLAGGVADVHRPCNPPDRMNAGAGPGRDSGSSFLNGSFASFQGSLLSLPGQTVQEMLQQVDGLLEPVPTVDVMVPQEAPVPAASGSFPSQRPSSAREKTMDVMSRAIQSSAAVKSKKAILDATGVCETQASYVERGVMEEGSTCAPVPSGPRVVAHRLDWMNSSAENRAVSPSHSDD